MDWTRRQFLASAAASAAALAAPGHRYFSLAPFIEANPKAVFIRRTSVAHKMDSAAKRAEGLNLAREIFVTADQPGVPLSHRIILKPNVTSVTSRGQIGRASCRVRV